MEHTNAEKIPFASGIDSLYYFAQSGAFYYRFYEDIVNQIEDKKAYYKSLNYAYADNDIIVSINEINVVYSGMGRDGFHWFKHDFFRAGFKDPEKAMNIHNICIQLNTEGTYTLGLMSLYEYVNTKFLGEFTMNIFHITRIDLNMFIQHDFKYLCKEMILSKKQSHNAVIGEISSGYELETYYVGKKPFKLRIYNKHKELQNQSSIKREIMHNHFGVNDFDLSKPIFNVEFEMHREYLKTFGIDTVEDALKRVEMLFKHACDQIKLIDINSITEKQLYSCNRKRASILPIWEFIKDSYSVTEFMQIDTPLEKIEKIVYRYTLEDADKSIKKIITRLLIHGNNPTMYFMIDTLEKAREDFYLRQNLKNLHDDYVYESSYSDDPRNMSDEGLIGSDTSIANELKTIPQSDPLHQKLFDRRIAICNEIDRRDLDNPFQG